MSISRFVIAPTSQPSASTSGLPRPSPNKDTTFGRRIPSDRNVLRRCRCSDGKFTQTVWRNSNGRGSLRRQMSELPRKGLRAAVLRYSSRSRARKSAGILRLIEDRGVRTVLFVGIGSDPGNTTPNHQILERAVAQAVESVTGCDIEEAASFDQLAYVRADGCRLPFRSKAFDLVVSNAVVEHVGDETRQRQFVSEHIRVGTHWVITTPNLWFPVESHTTSLVKHWSRGWRERQSAFTRLMSRRQFRDLLPPDALLEGGRWSPTFTATSAAPRRPSPRDAVAN